MIEIAIICLLLFMCLGVPVAFAIGFSGVLALAFGSDIPLFTAVQMAVRVSTPGRSWPARSSYWRAALWERPNSPTE